MQANTESKSTAADDISKVVRCMNRVHAKSEAISAKKILMLYQLRWQLIRHNSYWHRLEEIDKWLHDINQCNDISEVNDYFTKYIPIHEDYYCRELGIVWEPHTIKLGIPVKLYGLDDTNQSSIPSLDYE